MNKYDIQDVELILESTKLRAKLFRWRFAFCVFFLVFICVIFVNSSGNTGFQTFPLDKERVARVAIIGTLVNNEKRLETLSQIREDNRIKAVVLHLDSPGGTFVGGESLYRAIRKLSEQKPVVAVLGEIATSAAYMTAIATDRIWAFKGTQTGSIGVLVHGFEVTELAQKLGITFTTIKSSELKATLGPYEKVTPQAKEAIQAYVNEMYDMFLDMVKERRHISREKLLKACNGDVWSGRQALENGLIDAIGGESEALEWLEQNKFIKKGYVMIDIPMSNYVQRNILDILY